MSPLTIILLVVGVIIIILSFLIPDRDDKLSNKDAEKQREEIRRMLENELDSMKLRVNEATNETVEYGMNKYERSLDKIANEKMMAVGEYATTVMEEIDKSHKEVLFLYDMLNDKQADIKNSVRNAEAAVREISDATKNANETVANVVNSASIVKANMEASIDEYSEKQNQMLEQAKTIMVSENGARWNGGSYANTGNGLNNPGVVKSVFTNFDDQLAGDNDSVITPIDRFKSQEIPDNTDNDPEDEFSELKKTTFQNVSNNNQQIILLNKEGKSVIEIARQLGLGVGEVQLVLDLFK